MKRFASTGRKRRLRALLGWAVALAATLLVALALRRWVAQPLRIAGTSMEPALHGGDVVLATKFDYLRAAPARGDIVLCRLPGRAGEYVKRVVGLPGETIAIADGQTYIDGRPLAEAYASPAAEDFETTLGADEYFVMGDNRPQSYDSREEDIGSLASGDFLGRVRCVIWPLSGIFAGGL